MSISGKSWPNDRTGLEDDCQNGTKLAITGNIVTGKGYAAIKYFDRDVTIKILSMTKKVAITVPGTIFTTKERKNAPACLINVVLCRQLPSLTALHCHRRIA